MVVVEDTMVAEEKGEGVVLAAAGPSGPMRPAVGAGSSPRARWASAPDLHELRGELIGTREQVLACLMLQRACRRACARRAHGAQRQAAVQRDERPAAAQQASPSLDDRCRPAFPKPSPSTREATPGPAMGAIERLRRQRVQRGLP